ncbi:MAG TPA: PKD domain-containing protein [Mucilaginibacter sp.]|jgi:PKD repeat protein|nr:PKD domain-containing protein [Mucilaginibacter sp.]
MNRIITRRVFYFIILALFAVKPALGQTLTIHNFVPGTYTPGSTITAPFNIGSGGCIKQDNKFQLYLADASGNIVNNTPIGTFTGFYGTFVNGIIPAGTAAGTYTLVIKSTDPAVTSAPSPTFTVAGGAAVKADITGPSVNNNNPTVFGSCTGTAGSQYFFSNNSGTASATATFFNESAQTTDGTVVLASTGSFTAQTTNYTITVQTTNGTTLGTESYILLNNVVNNTFGSTNNNTVCLTGSGGMLSYNLDIVSPNGLQKNFPGNTYQVTWGDGVVTTYTICDLMNANGVISHNYTTGSCGNTVNGQNNAFEVDVQPQSTYCGSIGTRITSYAKIIRAPSNSFISPATACTGSLVTFTNTSDPGQDPNSNTNGCNNVNALYTWSVDGVVKLANAHLNQQFTYTFTTNGNHTVTLALQNGSGPCSAASITQTICIQNAPQPAFTLPSPACLSNPITATDQSVIDQGCNANTYLWAVTGPGSVTYANGTNNTSHQPQFVFSQPGVYQVTLSISSLSCTTVSVTHTINIDGPPVITMSADAAVCGTNLTYGFNPNPGQTQTIISGTAQATATTYSWTVTGDPGYSFVNGTTANSQYPQIKFTSFATYKVSVTETNSCGTLTKSQNLTFQNAPTVTLSANPTTICPGSSTSLTATVNGSYNSVQWTGSGVFSAPTSLTTTYTPTAAEINAGSATVTIDVKTSLSGQCADILQNITINIYPVDNITSATVKQICTGSPINYTIASAVPGSTFTWTAALTSGTATGFANGSGAAINDVLTNNTTSDAVVTYTITAKDPNGCTGPPFSFKVTVKPLSTVTATPASNTICSGSPAGINLSPTVAGTTYTWTSTISGNITGNTQQSTPVATTVINDVLNNTGATQGSVTYTITPFNSTCPGPATVVTINVQPLPVAANAGPNDEKCNITTYTLNGNTPPAGTGKWTVIPAAGITFSDATQPNAVASGLAPGTTYSFTWTITIPGCQSSSNSVAIKDDAPSVGGTTSGAATVCSGSNNGTVTLTGQVGNIIRWESSTDNGTTWKSINNITASQQYINLTATTQYRAVVQSGICSIDYSSVTTITVNAPPVQSNAGPNDAVCNQTAYTLQGNSAAPFTGQWTVTAGPPGATFADAANPTTTVSGLIPGSIYQFTWTITASAPCPTNSSSVIIRDDAPANGGTTSGSAAVCGGNNSGNITLSGQTGNIIRWESSTDNGTTWTPIANTSTTQQYLNLATTTQYQAVIQSGSCPIQFSTVSTITVSQPAIQANAGSDQTFCGGTSATLQGNNPAPSTGIWTQTAGPAATIVSPNSNQTQVTGLIPGNDYTFVWTIQGQAPCGNTSSSMQIHDANDVTPSFTADKSDNCGTYTVNFTNTSTSLTGTTFLWNFGDGSPTSNAVNPSHTYSQRNDGKDTVYTVSLSIVNNCVQRPPFTAIITVRPKDPIADILPAQLTGCSPFAITVANKSPGNNTGYVFYLYDGNNLVQQISKTDKSSVTFNPVTAAGSSKTYTVYMIATGFCNNTAESTHVPITVSPGTVTAQMFIQGNVNQGCVPFAVTFVNNSSGGDNYFYTIYDINNQPIAHLTAGTANYPYTFNTVGTYFVTITGSSNCGNSESPKTRVDVYPVPAPQFDADVKSGCKHISVRFANLTSDTPTAPASSLTYLWDFGDNTQASGFTPPAHTYTDSQSSYTVTLTATNPGTGCSTTVIKTGFITVSSPPLIAFTERPDSVTIIPNYTFAFTDQSTGAKPVKWTWTFGDGKSSTSQNPTHTYPDTGLYKVTLTVMSLQGCDTTISHHVRINGIPGQLFLPNAFEPAGISEELRIFKAKGSGIKQWHMQIFNNYSQLVWETTKLDSKGAPIDGWDGTFKGVPAPQGVYIWQVSASFLNGTEWKGNSYNSGSLPKRTGVIHLIR